MDAGRADAPADDEADGARAEGLRAAAGGAAVFGEKQRPAVAQAPTVAFTSPAEGTITTSNRPTVAFSYADAGLGVDTATVTLTIEGVAGTVACTKTATAATCTPTANVAAGRRVWTATVRDWAGNTATATRTITIDLANPTLTWVSPAANAWQASARPELVFTATDATSGVDPASFVLHRSSVTDVIPTSCTLAGTEVRCQPLADLGVGPAVVVNAKVKDFAGRLSTTTGRTLSIDASPPLIGFSQPAAGALVAAARPQLVLLAADGANESGIDETTVALTLGGAPLAATCTGTTTLACTPTADLPQGSVVLGATIRDRVGRLSAPAARSFTVDSIAPALAFTSPAAGSTTANGTPTFVLTASDAGGLNPSSLSFTANGTAFAAGCSWAGDTASCVPSAPLVSGATTVAATLRDAAGNSVTATLELVVAGGAAPPGLDVEAPWLAFSEPGHGGFFSTYAGTFELLAGDAESGIDATSVVLRAGGQTIPVTCAACWPRLRCALGAPLPAGDTVAVEVTVEDSQGNVSNLAQATWVTRAGLDLVAPRVWIDEPVAGLLVREGLVVVVGRVSELSTVFVAGQAVVLSAELAFTHTVVVAQGANPLTVTATDAAGNVGTAQVVVTFDDQAPGPVDVTKVTVNEPVDGFSTVTGAAGAVVVSEPGLRVELVDAEAGGSTTVAVASDGSFAGTLAAFPQDTLRLTVVDPAGNASPGRSTIVPGVVPVPPDPATVAPPLDPTVATGFCAAHDFLWTGANRVQYGLAADTLDCKTVGVLRGRVLDAAGQPLRGVRVRARDHARLGFTLTRADGAYDLAVPGGGPLTLAFEKDGRLPAVRLATPRATDLARVPEVVLVALDAQATPVTFGAGAPDQVARGSVVTDADGARRATLLVPAGTTAELVLPGGARQPLASGTVRATEYTVGPLGPAAMPAPLPPASFYTYAVELSVDEAMAAGAESVAFSRPIPVYLENFLSLPVGTAVPAGYYDRRVGRWLPSADGKVVRVLALESGLAVLDVTGSGSPATPSQLAALGVTDAERQQLAALYTAGQSLWRVPVSHFTPWDFNLPGEPAVPRENFRPPGTKDAQSEDERKKPDPCVKAGSVIECENQILGEAVELVGTSLSLHYASDQVPGRKAARQLKIPVTPVAVPAGVTEARYEVEIAGRYFTQALAPTANQTVQFEWDGEDAYGRETQGPQPYSVTVSYRYDARYTTPGGGGQSFGDAGQAPPVGPARQGVTASKSKIGMLGGFDAKKMVGLGGWTVSAHHRFDPGQAVVYHGDGTRRAVKDFETIHVSTETEPSGGTGDAAVPRPVRLVLSPAVPSLGDPVGGRGHYVLDGANCKVRYVNEQGQVSLVAGNGCNRSNWRWQEVEAAPATQLVLESPTQMETDAAGNLYLLDRPVVSAGQVSLGRRLYRISPQGQVTVLLQSSLGELGGFAVSPDGQVFGCRNTNLALYTLDRPLTQPLEVLSEATAFAGPLQEPRFDNDELEVLRSVPARNYVGNGCRELVYGPDGSLYHSDGERILRATPYGTLEHVVGNVRGNRWWEPPAEFFSGDGCPANGVGATGDCPASGAEVDLYSASFRVGQDGSLLLADAGNHRIRHIDPQGIIRTVVGAGPVGLANGGLGGENGPASNARLNGPLDVVLRPSRVAGDLALLIADTLNSQVRTTDPGDLGVIPAVAEYRVPSEDGSTIDIFDATGRHRRVEEAGSGTDLLVFGYDTDRLLTTITDAFGQVTTLERNGEGEVTRIVAPKGQATVVGYDGSGWLSTISNPAGEATTFTYTSDGLMLERREPKGNTTTKEWTADGLLLREVDALGGSQTLARQSVEPTSGGFDAYLVTHTTGMGRVTSYRTERFAGGAETLTQTAPDGLSTVTEKRADATVKTTYPDGTVAQQSQGPDPRFGMKAPIPTLTTVTLPSGLSVTTTSTREMPRNPNAPGGLLPTDSRNFLTKDTVTVGDRVARSEYDYNLRKLTTTTPEGRVSSSLRDAFGRLVRAESPGIAPVDYGYDAEGRVSEITQGDRTVSYTYNAAGFPWKVEDPLGREVSSTYDGAGRVTATTLTDGRQVQFAYDLNGNLTSITPPSRPAHGFGYNTTDRPNQSIAPEVGGTVPVTTLAYNLDHQVTQVTRPDGSTISYQYAPTSGRLLSTTTPRGVTTPTYDAAGRVTNVEGPGGEELALTYDGSLPKMVTWSGTVSGSLAYSYNSFLETSQVVVTAGAGAKTLVFSRNKDAQLTQAGAMSFSYDPLTGFGTGSALGNLTDEPSYTSFGELASYTARAGSAALFEATYTRDKLGRITSKTETVGNDTATWAYEYDLAGRLIEVEKDGQVLESYTYDANSNRTAWTDPWGTGTATYDDQDRLTAYAGTTFTYNANGERLTKTTGSGTIGTVYDVTGQLLQVTLPTGITIDYVLDAANRRVAKKVNGSLAKGYLWAGGSLVAELDAAGNLESTYVYGRKPHVPEYLLRGSETYRLITDPLGSVRLVVRLSDGQVVQRLDYSAFGRVLFDSNPGFQPFGYAGGLWEPQTGLVRFGARDYDPEVGRWTAKDPIGFSGGDTNLYGYVVGDPVNLVDPEGTTAWWIEAADFVGNVAAGFGDSISFGITDWMREQMGTNGAVDKCGGGYFVGEFGAFLYDLFKGGSGTIAKAGVKVGARNAAKSIGRESFKHAWIKRDLFRKLQREVGAADLKKFIAALKKGQVGPVGESGVKVLSASHYGYTHELKIGGSANRLLGKVDDGGVLVFDWFERGGLH